MPTAREMLAEAADKATIGHVDFPVTFFEVNMMTAGSNEEYIRDLLKNIHEHGTIVPQYVTLREKIAGLIFGFYINYSVYQQNDLHTNFNRVFDELENNRREIAELRDRIIELHREQSGAGER